MNIDKPAKFSITDIISGISDSTDLNLSKTLVEIEPTDDLQVKKLNLKSGTWDSKEPWLIVDENQNINTLLPISSVNKIIENYKASQEENFNLKLEKTIWQNVPIDFHDVHAVAMSEIEKIALNEHKSKNATNINLEKLLKKIRKEYPNLFLNIKDMLSN